jgi:hypothetical protein
MYSTHSGLPPCVLSKHPSDHQFFREIRVFVEGEVDDACPRREPATVARHDRAPEDEMLDAIAVRRRIGNRRRR